LHFPLIDGNYGHSIAQRKEILASSGSKNHTKTVSLLRIEYEMDNGHVNAIVGNFRQERRLSFASSMSGFTATQAAAPTTDSTGDLMERLTNAPTFPRARVRMTRGFKGGDQTQLPLLPPRPPREPLGGMPSCTKASSRSDDAEMTARRNCARAVLRAPGVRATLSAATS